MKRRNHNHLYFINKLLPWCSTTHQLVVAFAFGAVMKRKKPKMKPITNGAVFNYHATAIATFNYQLILC